MFTLLRCEHGPYYDLSKQAHSHTQNGYPRLLFPLPYILKTSIIVSHFTCNWVCRGFWLRKKKQFSMYYQRTTLQNGLRLLMAPMPGMRSASISFFFTVGSRYESNAIAGISHLSSICSSRVRRSTRQPGLSQRRLRVLVEYSMQVR